MTWTRQENQFRGCWEGRCVVTGCTSGTTTLTGPWLDSAQCTTFFRGAADRKGQLPGGWIFRRRRCEFADPANRKYTSRGPDLFCPEHALEWLAYEDAWEKSLRAQRKAHWLSFLCPWRGTPDITRPTSPFGVRAAWAAATEHLAAEGV